MNTCSSFLACLRPVRGGARAAREVVEVFGREALEAAEPRVARLIEAYGDDAAAALRKAGLRESRPWSGSEPPG